MSKNLNNANNVKEGTLEQRNNVKIKKKLINIVTREIGIQC